jgi:hypothetical protein
MAKIYHTDEIASYDESMRQENQETTKEWYWKDFCSSRVFSCAVKRLRRTLYTWSMIRARWIRELKISTPIPYLLWWMMWSLH